MDGNKIGGIYGGIEELEFYNNIYYQSAIEPIRILLAPLKSSCYRINKCAAAWAADDASPRFRRPRKFAPKRITTPEPPPFQSAIPRRAGPLDYAPRSGLSALDANNFRAPDAAPGALTGRQTRSGMGWRRPLARRRSRRASLRGLYCRRRHQGKRLILHFLSFFPCEEKNA